MVCAMLFLVAIRSNVFKENAKRLLAENRIELDELDPNTPKLLEHGQRNDDKCVDHF